MSTEDSDSITTWILAVKRGDDDAANAMWERYFPELLRLAEEWLRGQPPWREGEDVALSVIDSILDAVRQGRLDQLRNQNDLWRLLCATTRNKAIDTIRYNARRPEVGESHLAGEPGATDAWGLPGVEGDDLTPSVIVASLEEVRRLLSLLNENERRIVELRLAGNKVKQIANTCGRSVSSVELYLKKVRDKWTPKRGATNDPERVIQSARSLKRRRK